ncbi:MAG: flagellar biosynthetic protein FliQ [Bacteroidota bacterium]
MTDAVVINTVTQAILLILIVSAPAVLTSLAVGFIAALLMTITSIQEQTLSFVPKTVCVFGVIILVGPWLLTILVQFFTTLWGGIPAMFH